ncbi:pyridoxal phosphate-dependent transferase [Mycena maculata]|uniref:Pyridoxal phosphate-dependent transferase n=1 Tax=Mycena maculata TaxID=230809 RepID=A0AAD7KI58_9AGAR|nr:pyridoxal phosphate-dependent transferase [Mycena maculata]
MHLNLLNTMHTACPDSKHAAVSAWFLGPKAENHGVLRNAFDMIIDEVLKGRTEYFKDDKSFIDDEIKKHPSYRAELQKIEANVKLLSGLLAKHSCPSFSPRYAGHQTFETTLPAILGYVLGLLYNQNNLSPEIGPLTSWIEYVVGQQLCKMVGYSYNNIESESDLLNPENSSDDPVGWGHITCDGSVANLESMWVARNLKFYGLSLRKAMVPGQPLAFVADTFNITAYDLDERGSVKTTEKLFVRCSAWQLLNLTAAQVLGLPGRLSREYGISSAFVESIMQKYIIQTVGKDTLETEFKIAPCRYLISATNHYSWPKSAAITGIGSNNLVEASVDGRARMDTKDLDRQLRHCLENHIAVYAVVVIMGSTEHGAVDPLSEVIELRKKYEALGLTFLIHADAAWGGYFRTLTIPDPAVLGLRADPGNKFVPALALMAYTKRELEYLKYADSVTVDPHKTGYIPYPAGGLCYRDERLRFLVTWSSPYLNTEGGGVEAMGVYGLEGSKPGAAACATWLSHRVIGLHQNGYGTLLGEAMFTSVKMYSQWATMSLRSSNLIVVPFTKLPAEEDGKPKNEIEKERAYIQMNIVNRDNLDLVNDEVAMGLVKRMGSDLMINNFSCNFKIEGRVNKDIAEANYLNKRIYERLSIQKVTDDISERPVIIFSTVFSQAKYKEALKTYKNRLGLEGEGDLYTLCNISKTPFPTAGNFVKELADEFQKVAEQEIQNCYRRVRVVPDFHTFIIQGATNPFYLVQLPMFNVGNHRQQLIIKVSLSDESLRRWTAHRQTYPSDMVMVHTTRKEFLSTILDRGEFDGVVTNGLPAIYGARSRAMDGSPGFRVAINIVGIVKNRPLSPAHLDSSYPQQMPFYIYGSIAETHIDHMLLHAPNAQLSAGNITLDVEMDLSNPRNRQLLENGLDRGLIAVASSNPEFAMQPFSNAHRPAFFSPWSDGFKVALYADDSDSKGPGLVETLGKPITAATISLGSNVFSDWSYINQDAVLSVGVGSGLGAVASIKAQQDIQVLTDQTTKTLAPRPIILGRNVEESLERFGLVPPPTCAFNSVDGGHCSSTEILSRFLVREPADDFGRKLLIREGWKEAVDAVATAALK